MSVRAFRSSKRWAFLRYGLGAWLLVTLLFGAVATPEAWAATFFVNAATGNNSNTAAQAMSAATPWLTITRAITEPTLAPGDTINVAAGFYDNNTETFPLFLVDGVAIIGAGAPATTIFNVGTIFQNTNTPLSAATRLSAVELQAKGGVGMIFNLESVAMAPRIDNVFFTDTLGAGIQVFESTAGNSSFTALIENNTFDVDNTNVSIFQGGGGAGDVYSPTIRNNTFTPGVFAGVGIALTQSAAAAGIMAPTITGNTFTSANGGVEYSGTSLTGTSLTFAPLISNNTFTDNVQAITLSASDFDLVSNSETYTFSPTITSNTITGGKSSTGDGISISLSFLQTGHLVSNMLISGNTITDAGSNGMSLSISELFSGSGVDINWTVSNNTITNAGADGISLSVSSLTGGKAPGTFCVTLAGNTITGSGADGMSVSLAPGSSAAIAHTVLIRGNTITGNADDGITLSISSQAALTSNNIEITNNVLSNNEDDGLEISSSDAAVNGILVSCNTISGNSDDGIDLNSGTAPPPDFGGGDRASPGNNNITANVDVAFHNFDDSPVKAENNFWGLLDAGAIDAEINDDNENPLTGAVDFEPFRTTASVPADCPPGTTACGVKGPTPIPTLTPTGPPQATATPTPPPTSTPVSGPPPANVPTLGGWGMILLVALLALTGIVLSRRGGLLAILLLLFLTPGHGFGQPGKGKPPTAFKVGTVQKLERSAGMAVFRLNDGTLLKVAEGDLKLEDRRFRREKGVAVGADRLEARRKAKRAGEAALRTGTLAAGQAVVLKIKYGADGEVKKMKVFVYESAAAARRNLAQLERRQAERRKATGR